jgi:post-segregation antitoxin (ccd killing protein)
LEDGMPKVSVYLPDDLYRRARDRGLPLSRLTQAAVERALEEDANEAWVDALLRRPPRATRDFDTAELMDQVREEFGA